MKSLHLEKIENDVNALFVDERIANMVNESIALIVEADECGEMEPFTAKSFITTFNEYEVQIVVTSKESEKMESKDIGSRTKREYTDWCIDYAKKQQDDIDRYIRSREVIKKKLLEEIKLLKAERDLLK